MSSVGLVINCILKAISKLNLSKEMAFLAELFKALD